jgi:hypothetical protein
MTEIFTKSVCFGYSDIDDWSLFGIWDLVIGI